jgi:hypothetical protein
LKDHGPTGGSQKISATSVRLHMGSFFFSAVFIECSTRQLSECTGGLSNIFFMKGYFVFLESLTIFCLSGLYYTVNSH